MMKTKINPIQFISLKNLNRYKKINSLLIDVLKYQYRYHVINQLLIKCPVKTKERPIFLKPYIEALEHANSKIVSLIEVHNFEVDGGTLSKIFKLCAKTDAIRFVDVTFSSLQDFTLQDTDYNIKELSLSYCKNKDGDSDLNILKAMFNKICESEAMRSSLDFINFESNLIIENEYDELLEEFESRSNITLQTPNLDKILKDSDEIILARSLTEEDKDR